MSKVIFLNRYFYPDLSATSQILSDLAFYLSDKGVSVHVITSRLRYEGKEAISVCDEEINGVEIKRVWTSRFGRNNLTGRVVDYLTFYLSACLVLLRLAKKDDVIIVKTDPPLISVVVILVARLKRASVINWLQDIFPEIAKALGIRGIGRNVFWFLRLLRNYSLKAASKNVVIGEDMQRFVLSQGITKNKVVVIPNWADGSSIKPDSNLGVNLRIKWKLRDKFIVGYSGNMGRVHEFNTILDAANKLQEYTDIVFLFIGGGPRLSDVISKVDELGLKNVHFQSYQKREVLSESLNVPDIHLVSLRPELEGLVFPSKLYGIMAAGKPVLFIGDENSEISEMISKYEIGRQINIQDSECLSRTILEFWQEHEKVKLMGTNARQLFDECYDQRIAMKKWYNLLINK